MTLCPYFLFRSYNESKIIVRIARIILIEIIGAVILDMVI